MENIGSLGNVCILTVCAGCRRATGGGGGELGRFVCPDDLGHRDVTKREARNFEEFSKMAPLSFPNATFKVGFPGY